MSGLLQTRTDVVVAGALDGLAARHRVYANNIANIETPGFQPSEVPFEAQLRRMRDQMAQGPRQGAQVSSLSLDPVLDNQDSNRVDNNGVQADRQMVRLAESTLSYEALAEAARMRNQMLSSVITSGGK